MPVNINNNKNVGFCILKMTDDTKKSFQKAPKSYIFEHKEQNMIDFVVVFNFGFLYNIVNGVIREYYAF